jgi:hypothetical protein
MAENEDEGRYERTLWGLGIVFGGLSDPMVRARLADSLRARRLDRETVERLRNLLDEVLIEAV